MHPQHHRTDIASLYHSGPYGGGRPMHHHGPPGPMMGPGGGGPHDPMMGPGGGGPPMPMTRQPFVEPPPYATWEAGLEYLQHLTSIQIQQQLEPLEIMTGIETQNRYKIVDPAGVPVYYAVERVLYIC